MVWVKSDGSARVYLECKMGEIFQKTFLAMSKLYYYKALFTNTR